MQKVNLMKIFKITLFMSLLNSTNENYFSCVIDKNLNVSTS